MPKMVNRTAVGTYQGKLHNRQSGAYGKGGMGEGERVNAPLEKEKKAKSGAYTPTGKQNDVRCPGEVVDLSSLIPDPLNARLHPERNLEAIMTSLDLYGQLKPLVVRKQTMVVVAGNGTMDAAKALGWTQVAVNFTEMSDVEATGYGLADNRSAELAKWDFEVVARLDRLIMEAKHPTVGWTMDELEVLRAADWTPPPVSDEDHSPPGKRAIQFSEEQWEVVTATFGRLLAREGGLSEADAAKHGLDLAEGVKIICSEWFKEIVNA